MAATFHDFIAWRRQQPPPNFNIFTDWAYREERLRVQRGRAIYRPFPEIAELTYLAYYNHYHWGRWLETIDSDLGSPQGARRQQQVKLTQERIADEDLRRQWLTHEKVSRHLRGDHEAGDGLTGLIDHSENKLLALHGSLKLLTGYKRKRGNPRQHPIALPRFGLALCGIIQNMRGPNEKITIHSTARDGTPKKTVFHESVTPLIRALIPNSPWYGDLIFSSNQTRAIARDWREMFDAVTPRGDATAYLDYLQLHDFRPSDMAA